MRRRASLRRTLLVLGIVLVGSLAGCSGGGNGGFGPLPSFTRASGASASPGPSSPTPPARVIRIATPGFRYEPAVVRVGSGESVVLELHNSDTRTHSLTVDELSLQMIANPGETVRLPVVAPAGGSFTMYCSIAGHLQAGHRGRIDVG